jgi:hypothetical protein
MRIIILITLLLLLIISAKAFGGLFGLGVDYYEYEKPTMITDLSAN